MAESPLNESKTLLEKEKLLVTSNFSFSYCVFKRLVLQTRKTQGLYGQGLSFANLKVTQVLIGYIILTKSNGLANQKWC